jgi:hypothetical protein
MSRKILYYDCFAGISGDMNLAAMLDLGVPLDHLKSELRKIHLHGYEIKTSADARKGISGTKVDIVIDEHTRDDHRHHHEHRTFASIKTMIDESSLADSVKKLSKEMFLILAEAEGKVHGTPAENVSFHEVGAVDSIVDIVGAAVCLEYLKPDIIICSTIELGGGFVRCQHGLLPVPAPATALVLTGIPVKSDAVPFEMTTPTGAAIIAVCADEFTDRKDFTINKIGYGVGHRDTEIPNLLRIFLAEKEETAEEGDCIIECNLDDMNPEIYGHISDILFAAGAADVYFTPIIMKKSRPAVKISVLCHVSHEKNLSDILLRETTTFGLRRISVKKTALERRIETIGTSLGNVRVKSAVHDGRVIKSKPEYEDCRAIAIEKGLPLTDVYRIIQKELQ